MKRISAKQTSLVASGGSAIPASAPTTAMTRTARKAARLTLGPAKQKTRLRERLCASGLENDTVRYAKVHLRCHTVLHCLKKVGIPCLCPFLLPPTLGRQLLESTNYILSRTVLH